VTSKRRRRSLAKHPRHGTPPSRSVAVRIIRIGDWRLPAVVVGIGAYLLLFYTAGMPSLSAVGGAPFRRVDLVAFFAFPDAVAAQWWDGDVWLLDRLPLLVGAVAIHLAAAAIGWLLIRLLRAHAEMTKAELIVFSHAAGLSAISLYTLLVGLAGGLRCGAWIGLPLLFCAGFSAWRGSRRARRGRQDAVQLIPRADGETVSSSPRAELSSHWLWLGAQFVAVVLLGGMLPPVEFDVREYHLQAPKEFYELGRITYLPNNAYANMPLGSQMFSLLAMAVTGDWWTGALIGKTTTALFAPLTAWALFTAGRRLFGTTCGVVAAVAYISIPWIVRTSTAGLVEGASAHYLFLAVYAVVLFRDRDRTARIGKAVLAGFMAGSAVAVKYPAALFVLLPLTVWIAVIAFRSTLNSLFNKPGATAGLSSSANISAGNTAGQASSGTHYPGVPLFQFAAKRCGYHVILFIGAALLACGPWFAKNWLLTGNPTYPLLAGVFPDTTGTRTPELIDRWIAAHRPDAYSPADFANQLADVLWRSEWLSPLLMPLAALAWMRSLKKLGATAGSSSSAVSAPESTAGQASSGTRLIVPLFCYLLFVFLAWWLFTHRIDRFWVPALPVVALLAGVGAGWSSSSVWKFVLVLLLIAGSAVNLLTVTIRGPGNDNRYFVALASLRTDPQRVDAWHLRLNRLYAERRAAGLPMKVLSVGDAEVFDLEMPVLYNTVFDPSWLEAIVKDRSPDDVLAELRRRHITHIFVHWGEIARYRLPGNYGFSEFVEPEVFEILVRSGALLPPLREPNHPGEMYEVLVE